MSTATGPNGDCGWGYGAGPCGPGGGLYSYGTSTEEAVDTLIPTQQLPHAQKKSDVVHSCMSVCFRMDRVILGTSWNYVGEGRGGYSKVSTYNYVGHGGGSFEKEVRKTHHGWRPRRCCLVVSGSAALLLVGLCTVVALHGKMGIPAMPAASGGDSLSSASDTTPDSLTGDADCVVDPSAKDPYHNWNIQQHEWCCYNYQLGCHWLIDRMREKAQQHAAHMPAQMAAQVPRNESLFTNSSSSGNSRSNSNTNSSNTNSSTYAVPQELPSENKASDSGSAEEMLPAGNTSTITSVQELLPAGNTSATASVQETLPAGNTSSSGLVQETLPRKGPRNPFVQDATTVEASTTTAPEYNCDEDRGSWKTAWSRVKQTWCCSRHSVGCSTVALSFA